MRRLLSVLGVSTEDMPAPSQQPITVPGAGGDHAVTATMTFLDECHTFEQPRWELRDERTRDEFMLRLHTFIEQRTGARVDDVHLRRVIFASPQIMRHPAIIQEHETLRRAGDDDDDVVDSATVSSTSSRSPPPPQLPPVGVDMSQWSDEERALTAVVVEIGQRLQQSIDDSHYLETSAPHADMFTSIITVAYAPRLHRAIVDALLVMYPIDMQPDNETYDDFTVRPRFHQFTVLLDSDTHVLSSAVFIYECDPNGRRPTPTIADAEPISVVVIEADGSATAPASPQPRRQVDTSELVSLDDAEEVGGTDTLV